MRNRYFTLKSNKTRSELSLNKEVAQVVTRLLATLFLQTLYEYIEPLKADMSKYGSLKKAIEVQLRN
jgi:hypothetical protein